MCVFRRAVFARGFHLLFFQPVCREFGSAFLLLVYTPCGAETGQIPQAFIYGQGWIIPTKVGLYIFAAA
jgi:hypothetical protein